MDAANYIDLIPIKLPPLATMEDKMRYLRMIMLELQQEEKLNVLSTKFVDGYAILEVRKQN